MTGKRTHPNDNLAVATAPRHGSRQQDDTAWRLNKNISLIPHDFYQIGTFSPVKPLSFNLINLCPTDCPDDNHPLSCSAIPVFIAILVQLLRSLRGTIKQLLSATTGGESPMHLDKFQILFQTPAFSQVIPARRDHLAAQPAWSGQQAVGEVGAAPPPVCHPSGYLDSHP